MEELENLAYQWVSIHHKEIDIENIQAMISYTEKMEPYVWFYDVNTWEDLSFIITVPMTEKLLNKTKPKNIKNSIYLTT